jgi:uncharacterized membrane protein
MANLALASLFLPLTHFIIASTRLRHLLVRRLGEERYLAAYSLLTVAAFAWLVVAYHYAPSAPLWHAAQWVDFVLAPLILIASLLVVAALSTPSPVIVRSEQLFRENDVVRGILRISRNSFFWGMSIFALSHVIMIGDVAATLAFGSVAALGLAGSQILDAKKARRHGAGWEEFAAATSDVPFLAIVQRRQRLVLAEIGWRRISTSVAVFSVALSLHPSFLGGHAFRIVKALFGA